LGVNFANKYPNMQDTGTVKPKTKRLEKPTCWFWTYISLCWVGI